MEFISLVFVNAARICLCNFINNYQRSSNLLTADIRYYNYKNKEKKRANLLYVHFYFILTVFLITFLSCSLYIWSILKLLCCQLDAVYAESKCFWRLFDYTFKLIFNLYYTLERKLKLNSNIKNCTVKLVIA